ncbi:hypothetical protein ACLOJK_037394 [Asimina triloba]
MGDGGLTEVWDDDARRQEMGADDARRKGWRYKKRKDRDRGDWRKMRNESEENENSPEQSCLSMKAEAEG